MDVLPRVHGTEMEWAISYQEYDVDGYLKARDSASNYNLAKWAKDYTDPKTTNNLTAIDSFLSNGARLYVDVGEHLEYATPEDTSFASTVANEIAGERIVHNLVARGVDETKNIHGYEINKRVIANGDEGPVVWGYHESYAVRRQAVIDSQGELNPDKLALFGAHMVTRNIFFGAGALLKDGTYVIGQKAMGVTTDISPGTTHSAKPVINTRDEPLADRTKWLRVHGVMGDPNISPWATHMKLATSSLVLRLIEHHRVIPGLRMNELAQNARLVATDTTLKRPIPLAYGKTMLPIDIQQELAEACLALSDEIILPPEEVTAASEWLRACENTKKDPDWLLTHSDWYFKQREVERYRRKNNLAPNSRRLQGMERSWDSIRPGADLATVLRNKLWDGSWSIPEETILDRTVNPPPGGRAALRGKFIVHCATDFEVHCQWDRLRTNETVISLPDPYMSRSSQLEGLLLSKAS